MNINLQTLARAGQFVFAIWVLHAAYQHFAEFLQGYVLVCAQILVPVMNYAIENIEFFFFKN